MLHSLFVIRLFRLAALSEIAYTILNIEWYMKMRTHSISFEISRPDILNVLIFICHSIFKITTIVTMRYTGHFKINIICLTQ